MRTFRWKLKPSWLLFGFLFGVFFVSARDGIHDLDVADKISRVTVGLGRSVSIGNRAPNPEDVYADSNGNLVWFLPIVTRDTDEIYYWCVRLPDNQVVIDVTAIRSHFWVADGRLYLALSSDSPWVSRVSDAVLPDAAEKADVITLEAGRLRNNAMARLPYVIILAFATVFCLVLMIWGDRE